MKLRHLIPLILCIFFAGCSQTHVDPYKGYRQFTAKQLYDHGIHRLAKKDFAQAAKTLEALNGLYPFGRYAEPGQLDLIYAYFKDDQKAAAVAASDRYIRLYPQNPHVAYAYYIRGLVQFQMGMTWLQRLWGTDPAPRSMIDKQQAFLAFSQVARFYPNSPYAPDAVMRMNYIRNEIARKNLLVAKYYWDRGAFVASADRASYIVQHFQGTPAVVPALAIMVKSYDKLGLPTMANYSMAILQASYPTLAPKELKKIS